ncbi:MAG: transcriptional regulator [Paracoccus denitrificans]|nr:MAG: transcriptional regulator [Paracoccus denitrificans]PZO84755.1 MAG: transcriptional regulator [Paracoccus denitrificans]
MYTPPAFAEDRPEVMVGLIETYPLGMLITHGADGPTANLIPMQWSAETQSLQCHLAKANPQIAELRDMAAHGHSALIVFQGPHAYISPRHYATKAETGKVVPTWNFLMVQVRGIPVVTDDALWLRRQLDALTDQMEGALPSPWAVADAPESFVTSQMRGIVGVEIPASQMAGKWKASQNRSAADRLGVKAGLGDNPLAAAVPDC